MFELECGLEMKTNEPELESNFGRYQRDTNVRRSITYFTSRVTSN